MKHQYKFIYDSLKGERQGKKRRGRGRGGERQEGGRMVKRGMEDGRMRVGGDGRRVGGSNH